MLELRLNLPVYQAILDRRRKVLILAAHAGRFKRYDAIRVLEVQQSRDLQGTAELTGNWCFARVTWSEMTEDNKWSVLSIEPVTPTLEGIGPPAPSDDTPTRPDSPVPRKPPPRDDGA